LPDHRELSARKAVCMEVGDCLAPACADLSNMAVKHGCTSPVRMAVAWHNHAAAFIGKWSSRTDALSESDRLAGHLVGTWPSSWMALDTSEHPKATNRHLLAR
jgi:hypothetical protein